MSKLSIFRFLSFFKLTNFMTIDILSKSDTRTNFAEKTGSDCYWFLRQSFWTMSSWSCPKICSMSSRNILEIYFISFIDFRWKQGTSQFLLERNCDVTSAGERIILHDWFKYLLVAIALTEQLLGQYSPPCLIDMTIQEYS